MEARDRLGGRVSPTSAILAASSRYINRGLTQTAGLSKLSFRSFSRYVSRDHDNELFLALFFPFPETQKWLLTRTRGPNWIHGTLTNPIVKLAKETNTTLSQVEDSTRVYDERGHPIDEEEASKASDAVWSIIAEAFKYSNANCSNIAPNISLKDFFVKKLDEDGVPQNDQKLIMQMAEMWGAFTGDPWERQSLKYFWLEECLDGGRLPYVIASSALVLS